MSEGIPLIARIELADSGGVICAVYQKTKYSFEFQFIRNEKIFFTKSMMNPDEDKFVDLLTEAEVEFITFSAIYDAAGLLEDVIKDPKEIYKKELEKLKKHFKILEKKELDPYEIDHMLVVMQKI